jgi:hypothetical protein
MLELTGIASVLRGASILYWIVALSVIALVLWKVRGWSGKTIATVLVVGAFGYLPATSWLEAREREAYAREAWAYFKKLCDEKSGEKIYKTFTGVKSVLVVKPLPPATEKDLYDQFWYGDPYSNDSALGNRGELHASTLIRNQEFLDGRGNTGLQFFEQRITTKIGEEIQRIEPSDVPPYFVSKSTIDKPTSRFGISWEDISTPEDRKYWVAGSRLRILDLTNNSVVAERVGYFIEAGFGSTSGQRRPWQTSRGQSTTCPAIINRDFSDRWFILKVINPSKGF